MPKPLDELLGRVPVPAWARSDVTARLAAPGRHYHGAGHVLALWRNHRRFRAGLPLGADPWDCLVACAIAFHDAIHDPRRRDNEARSAALWRAARPDLPAAQVAWVEGTILATADHLRAAREPAMPPDAWAARLWMLDLDLTPLGAAPEAFDANTARLRREYAHVAGAAWDAERVAFLRAISGAPRLFRSPVLAAAFEGPARANIARALGVGMC